MRLPKFLVPVIAAVSLALPAGISPAYGPAGTAVTVTGTGFPKKTPGAVSAGSGAVAFTASASGYFKASLIIPESGDGVGPVMAVSGKVSASAPFTLTYSWPPVPEPDSDMPMETNVGTDPFCPCA